MTPVPFGYERCGWGYRGMRHWTKWAAGEQARKRPEVPQWGRDLQVQAKGERLSWERKRKRIYRVGGQRGRRDQKGDGGVRAWAGPKGSPYPAALKGEEASPVRRTQKDRRRRRPELAGPGLEPPLAVAILPLRGAEAPLPLLPGSGLSRLPGAPSRCPGAPETGSSCLEALPGLRRRVADVEAAEGQRGVAGAAEPRLQPEA